MAFFSNLKRFFGFGSHSDDELLQDAPAAGDNTAQTPAADSVRDDEPDAVPELDENVRRQIFEHVVEVFNGAMPQFIRDSVDPNAQTDYIYRTLDDSVKAYFDSMDHLMQRKAERAFEERNEKLTAELENLRKKSRLLEEERTTLRERQLSADRQRRTLADRVQDLEQKIAALDADREQLQLENRSLLNKLRLQSVEDHSPVPQPEAAEAAAPSEAEREQTAKLTAKLEKTKAERNSAREALKQLEAQHAELQQQLQPLMTDNAKLHEAMKKQADMHRISEAMMGDLRRSAALTREELNNERRRANELENQLNQTDDLRQELHAARQKVQELSEVHSQADSLRVALDEERRRIADLERQIADGDRTAELTDKCSQLETDLAKVRARLREAEGLLAEVAAEAMAPYQKTKNGRRKADDPSIPAISEDALRAMEVNFSDENWRTENLLADAEAQPQQPKRRGRPAKRANNNDDDPQLSLF